MMDGGMEKRAVGRVGERAERWWWDGWVEAWGDVSVVGQVDRQMGGQMGGWASGMVGREMIEWRHRVKSGWTKVWMDGWGVDGQRSGMMGRGIDGQTSGWMDKGQDGQRSGWTERVCMD